VAAFVWLLPPLLMMAERWMTMALFDLLRRTRSTMRLPPPHPRQP
jgi:hypothetical protein